MSDEKDDKKSDDLLEGLDEHLQDPAKGARQAGEELTDEEETAEELDETNESTDGDNDNKDEETETESDEEDLTLKERHEYLKGEVGRQANEIGGLKDQIKALQPQAKEVEVIADPLIAKMEAAKKLYGPEIVELIVDVADSRVAPVQQAQGVQKLKDRYDDFDDVRADMDEIFKGSPALRAAASKGVKVLDTVYAAAKAAKGGRSESESTQKGEAHRKRMDEAKEAAHVEKPSIKADTPKKVTQKQQDDGFIDHIVSLPPNA